MSRLNRKLVLVKIYADVSVIPLETRHVVSSFKLYNYIKSALQFDLKL